MNWDVVLDKNQQVILYVCFMITASPMSDAEVFSPLSFFSPFLLFLQSFKLNVDSHCALKEAVVEEGRQLLELIVSHKSGKSF